MRWAPGIALLLALAGPGCFGAFPRCGSEAPIGSVDAGDHEMSFCVAGRTRTALVHVPDAPRPLPLLLMLHGGGGNALQLRATSLMNVQADQEAFIVVYPQGTPARRGSEIRTWNAMHCCGAAFDDGTDDVAFLGHLIDAFVVTGSVDPLRVGVAGHSNGAMMAYRVAAARSDVVTAVMPVAGAIGGEPRPGGPVLVIPAPVRPVSVPVQHASDDPRVPYEGGEGDNLDGRRVDLSVADAVAFWRGADGIAGSPNVTLRDDGVLEERHPPGLNGTYVLVLTTRGGHGWPGSAPGPLNAAPTAPIASREIAAFLKASPRT